MPSPSKEAKLRTTEEVGFVLAQMGCIVTKGLKKPPPPPANKHTHTNQLAFTAEQEGWYYI